MNENQAVKGRNLKLTWINKRTGNVAARMAELHIAGKVFNISILASPNGNRYFGTVDGDNLTYNGASHGKTFGDVGNAKTYARKILCEYIYPGSYEDVRHVVDTYTQGNTPHAPSQVPAQIEPPTQVESPEPEVEIPNDEENEDVRELLDRFEKGEFLNPFAAQIFEKNAPELLEKVDLMAKQIQIATLRPLDRVGTIKALIEISRLALKINETVINAVQIFDGMVVLPEEDKEEKQAAG